MGSRCVLLNLRTLMIHSYNTIRLEYFTTLRGKNKTELCHCTASKMSSPLDSIIFL